METKTEMTAGNYVRSVGIESLNFLSRESGVYLGTLTSWYKNKRYLFDIIVESVLNKTKSTQNNKTLLKTLFSVEEIITSIELNNIDNLSLTTINKLVQAFDGDKVIKSNHNRATTILYLNLLGVRKMCKIITDNQ